MGMIQEFKKFALRGNAIDMAVGIIIGGAFGGVVKSLVEDVLMPPIAMFTGKVDFRDLALPLVKDAAGKATIAIKYGSFINSLISFLIVAWAVFLLVKAINLAETRLRLGQQPAEDVPPPSEEVLLLREIRDALKRQ